MVLRDRFLPVGVSQKRGVANIGEKLSFKKKKKRVLRDRFLPVGVSKKRGVKTHR